MKLYEIGQTLFEDQYQRIFIDEFETQMTGEIEVYVCIDQIVDPIIRLARVRIPVGRLERYLESYRRLKSFDPVI